MEAVAVLRLESPARLRTVFHDGAKHAFACTELGGERTHWIAAPVETGRGSEVEEHGAARIGVTAPSTARRAGPIPAPSLWIAGSLYLLPESRAFYPPPPITRDPAAAFAIASNDRTVLFSTDRPRGEGILFVETDGFARDVHWGPSGLVAIAAPTRAHFFRATPGESAPEFLALGTTAVESAGWELRSMACRAVDDEHVLVGLGLSRVHRRRTMTEDGAAELGLLLVRIALGSANQTGGVEVVGRVEGLRSTSWFADGPRLVFGPEGRQLLLFDHHTLWCVDVP